MLLSELLRDIAQKADYSKPHSFLDPVPNPQIQRGECCKLFALQTVMQWLYKTDAKHPVPPPTRRAQALFNSESLRHQAKRVVGSQVGEIYDVRSLVTLAQLNSYDQATVVEADDNYCDIIKGQLEQGYAPIVIFDIDFETKGPGFHQSNHEHAAVIVGYFHDAAGTPWFVATCWGSYFTYPADKLARSAAQLAKQRTPETFYKIAGEWRSEQGRYNIMPGNKIPVRQGLAATETQASFYNKIVLVKASSAEPNRKIFGKTIDQIQLHANTKALRKALPERNTNAMPLDVPAHFIPLTELISFLTLDLIQAPQKRLSQEKLERLLSSSDLKKMVHERIYVKNNAWIDDSIEGDIYSQNKHRSRSIVEEISNSLDATPKAIECTIQDAYYQIREINGIGMSALTVCMQYLIPKESSKINSSKQIGRFGIGSFTKLAHLNNPDAKILVCTKTAHSIGLRMEFRLINNQIHVALMTDASIIDQGTCIEVHSSEIVQQEYQDMVTRSVEPNPNIPIYLNGTQLSQRSIKPFASISINGICIQKIEQEKDAFVTQVQWQFPAKTSIAEGRDKIIVDSVYTADLIRKQIMNLSLMDYPQWALYANTIAPLVLELQASNTSLFANDDLMDFLKNTVAQKLENKPCIIDSPLYRPMAINNLVRLHPLLLPKNWLSSFARLASDWDPQKTQVWVADMLFCDAGDFFIFDKDNNRVFIERNYYHQILRKDSLEQLKLVLSYPPKEIDVVYSPHRKDMPISSNTNPSTKPANTAIENALSMVTYNPELSAHPFHKLYQRHGILWQKGEAVTKDLLNSHAGMDAVLMQAKTLIALYPSISYFSRTMAQYDNHQIFKTSIRSNSLASFRFNGDLFYYNSSELFDKNFHPLSHEKWKFLKAKIKKTIAANPKNQTYNEQNITLSKEDILLIENIDLKKTELYRGTGQILGSFVRNSELRIVPLSDPAYYLIIEESHLFSPAYLFHIEKGRILNVTTSRSYNHRLLRNNTWLTVEYRYGISNIYDLQKGTELFTNAERILLNNDYVLYKNKSNQFVLANYSGAVYFEFTSKPDVQLIDFHCQQPNPDEINLSLLDEFGSVQLLRASKTDVWNFEWYDHNQCLAYPVQAFIKLDTHQLTIQDLKNNKTSTLNNVTIKTYSEYNKYSRSVYKESFLNINLPPAETNYKPNYLLVKNNSTISIFHPKKLELIPLNFSCDLNTISSVKMDKSSFILKHTVKNETISTLVDDNGKKIVSSTDIDQVYNTTHDLVCVANDDETKPHILLNQAGYPFFNEPLPKNVSVMCHNTVLVTEKSPSDFAAVLQPINLNTLKLPQALDNLQHLNQLSLDAFVYGLCLRFIDWPSAVFQQIIPHIHLLTYTAELELAQDYHTIITYCDNMSESNRLLIIQLFNLLHLIVHEQAHQAMANKLIYIVQNYGLNTLIQLNEMLQEHQYELRFHGTEYSKCKPIIDNYPKFIAQLYCYLLYPEHLLLSANTLPIFKPFVGTNSISLLDFMCAYQQDTQLLELTASNPEQLVKQIQKLGSASDKAHFLRVLQHALYHQADPGQHLYEREFLQNALDAYVGHQTQDAVISARVYEENGHCVFQIQDQGNGMSLRDVLQFYCLVGGSTKRADNHHNFIGGHGVGVFTAYQNAEYIRLQTGQNQGYFYQVILKPIYSTDNKITDIQVSWKQQTGTFKGTIIERVARGTVAALDAARHLRTFKSHARTIDAHKARILFNDELVNQPLTPLASVVLPDLGPLRVYQSVEDMITVAGLSVRPIGDIDNFIPEEIRSLVRKQGLIIDLPKTMALNRERTEFIDAINVYEFLKPYLISVYIEAYIHLFTHEQVALSELPYDFFVYFELYTSNMEKNNPRIKQDAEAINANQPIADFQFYQHLARLHELLAYLPLFKTEKDSSDQSCEIHPEKYSLLELAAYYTKNKMLPKLISTPEILRSFAYRFDSNKMAIELQKQRAFDLGNVPAVEWLPDANTLNGNWLTLVNITKLIAKEMGNDIQVGFSTYRNGAIMHTSHASDTIYWNVFSVSRGVGSELFQALKTKSLKPSSHELHKLCDVISHELTHALMEEQHTNSHNRTFYLKQRKILSVFFSQTNQEELIQTMYALFAQNYPIGTNQEMFDWKPFVQQHLLNRETLTYIEGLFANKKVKVKDEDVDVRNRLGALI